MFDPRVIAAKQDVLERRYQTQLPKTGLVRHPMPLVQEWKARLEKTRDDKGNFIRKLSSEEEAFVRNEWILSKIDVPYFLERYVYINVGGAGLAPLCPLWESQRIIMQKMGEIEYRNFSDGRREGVLVNVLKSRQLGASTLSQAIISHRMMFYTHVFGLVASDVPESSAFMFDMFERIVSNLPWYLKPRVLEHVKNGEMVLDNDSHIWVGSGRSTRGVEGKRGQLGRGKSQPLDAPVLTPTGWTTMGDLKIGDLVVGSDGRPTVVVGVYPQGYQPTCRVTFSDKSSVECSEDHLWSVQEIDHDHTWSKTTVERTTTELRDNLLERHNAARYRIPITKPVTFIRQEPLLLDPYLLGILIGDGSLCNDSIFVSSADPEIVELLKHRIPSGHSIKQRSKYDYAITTSIGSPNKVIRALKTLGLMGHKASTKRIPEPYRFASVPDRIHLLQGLMDSDGWITGRNRLGYSTISPQLADDITELAQSLGGVVSRCLKHPKYTYKGVKKNGQLAYGISFWFPREIEPFRLQRKKDKYFETMSPQRRIVKIEKIEDKLSQCIRVTAPDQLYLTKDYIVTHNTMSAICLSELSTWEDAAQVNGSLLPAVPYSPRVVWINESTAKGRHNEWHKHWLSTDAGHGRFHNIFIPWYVEPKKYSRPAPTAWTPMDSTISHGMRCEEDSPRFMGHRVTLSRDQLYWYERERAMYEDRDELATFMEEYAADPESAFQFSGKGVFSLKVQKRIRDAMRQPIAVMEINSNARLTDPFYRERAKAMGEGLHV